jgi:predicted glycoside hydrolase/deacetylase ChbG (UPF0249 family)
LKGLIIAADDLGHDEGAVPGLPDLYQVAVVSSTSALTHVPAWPQAVACVREHPELGSS